MDIRLARASDAEAIRQIYNREVLESVATFDTQPRSLEAQTAWLEQRSGAHLVVVAADEEGRLMGFGSLSPYRERPAYNTTVESSVYVHRDHHRRGVGRALVTTTLEAATERGFHTVMAKIAGEQAASVALHEACGYSLVGIEREVGRKFGRWLDVVIMQRMLQQDTP